MTDAGKCVYSTLTNDSSVNAEFVQLLDQRRGSAQEQVLAARRRRQVSKVSGHPERTRIVTLASPDRNSPCGAAP